MSHSHQLIRKHSRNAVKWHKEEKMRRPNRLDEKKRLNHTSVRRMNDRFILGRSARGFATHNSKSLSLISKLDSRSSPYLSCNLRRTSDHLNGGMRRRKRTQ